MRFRPLIFTLIFLSSFVSFAQSTAKEYEKRFLFAKELLRTEQYDKSFEEFKKLADGNIKNRFSDISHYYCGLSAYHLQRWPDTRFILVKLLKSRPSWKRRDEAFYLLAAANFEEKSYDKAFQYLDTLQKADIKKDGEKMEAHYLHQVNSVDTLKTWHEARLKDNVVAQRLAEVLNYSIQSYQDKLLLQYLIQDYKLDPKKFSMASMKSVKKDVYRVALLLPLELDKPENYRKSRRYFEFLEGVRMAKQDLILEGQSIELFVYDTKRDTATTNKIVALPELCGMDLLIGPVLYENSEIVSGFAEFHGINYVNPFLKDDALVDGRSMSFLAFPSNSMEGIKTADYIVKANDTTNTAIIFYSEGWADSVNAYAHAARLDSLGKKVKALRKITLEEVQGNTRDFNEELAKMLEDEDLSHIYVAADQNLIAASLMSVFEQNNVSAPIFVPSKWLDIKLLNYDQFLRRNVHFIYPDYEDLNKPELLKFRTAFGARTNLKPLTNGATMGYEVMNFYGHAMKLYGNRFNQNIQSSGFTPGKTLYGFDYSMGNANAVVPIFKFDSDYKLDWVNRQ